jgi:hypothetical protein
MPTAISIRTTHKNISTTATWQATVLGNCLSLTCLSEAAVRVRSFPVSPFAGA